MSSFPREQNGPLNGNAPSDVSASDRESQYRSPGCPCSRRTQRPLPKCPCGLLGSRRFFDMLVPVQKYQNAKGLKRTLIYFNTDTQYQNVRGNLLCPATKIIRMLAFILLQIYYLFILFRSIKHVTSRPTFFCSSLVKSEPTWLRTEQL